MANNTVWMNKPPKNIHPNLHRVIIEIMTYAPVTDYTTDTAGELYTLCKHYCEQYTQNNKKT
jgi:hypothetical protein